LSKLKQRNEDDLENMLLPIGFNNLEDDIEEEVIIPHAWFNY